MEFRLSSIACASTVALLFASSSLGAVGRTPGAGGVDPTGAYTYQIPLWTPPGPRNVQPNLSLIYSSRATSGIAGMGWSLAGLSEMARCPVAKAQGGPRPVAFMTTDGYCLDGQLLQLTSSGNYGLAGSTYQTETANFSLITAVGSTGAGPVSFTVKTKSGLTYFYGGAGNSSVIPSGKSAPLRWLLNKVADRSGNNYLITYGPGQAGSSGVAIPTTISWTPTTAGGSTYSYSATFAYTTRATKDQISSNVAGATTTDTNLLSSIEIRHGSTTVRYYKLGYEAGPSTSRARLNSFKECADVAMSECLSPTTMTYLNGATGVNTSSSTAVSSSTSSVAAYDFDHDGRDDLLFNQGGTLMVAFSTGTGFGTPKSTGASFVAAGQYDVADLAGNGKISVIAQQSGTWNRYSWNGTAFVSEPLGGSPGIAVDSGAPPNTTPYAKLMDVNGDGLPDLVTFLGVPAGPSQFWNGQIYIRLNTSANNVISFASTRTTLALPACSTGLASTACVPVWQPVPQVGRQIDINNDGRDDLIVGYVEVGIAGPGGPPSFQRRYTLLSTGNTFSVSPGDASVATSYHGTKRISWNDDRCDDAITLSPSNPNAGNVIVSACDGTTAQSYAFAGAPLATADWDGDGRTDLIVRDMATLSVYLSTSNGIGSEIPTTIFVGSSDEVVPLDIDGDGLVDLAIVSGSGSHAITFQLHNAVDFAPDLLASVTDGFGVANAITYAFLPDANVYEKATTAIAPERNITIAPGEYTTTINGQPAQIALDGFYVVKQLTLPNGIGQNYHLNYKYFDGRENIEGRGFEGFDHVQVTDDRNSQVRVTHYDLLYPLTGMTNEDDLFQSLNGNPISKTTIANQSQVLEPTAGRKRTFPYIGTVSAKQYEVQPGGAKDGQLITTVATTFNYADFTYGNVETASTTTTDNDPDSPFHNEIWTTSTTKHYVAADITDWCVDLLTDKTDTKTGPTPLTPIPSSLQFTPDSVASACRYHQIVAQPSDNHYRVETTLGYDTFGNNTSSTVVGLNPNQSTMTARVRSADFGTTGQFPVSATNAAGETTTFGYDYDRGLRTSITDPNNVTSSMQYDHFGRPDTGTAPDTTTVHWSYQACAPNCVGSLHKMTVVETANGVGGSTVVTDSYSYVDAFDRTFVERSRLLGGDYQWNEVQFDQFGRVSQRNIPCSTSNATSSCTSYWERFDYDSVGRPTASRRPQNALNPSVEQTTAWQYAGRAVTTTDANSRAITKVIDVEGRMRISTDANLYSQNFFYDSSGNLTSVTDSSAPPRTLFSATYEQGIDAFQVSVSNPASGTRTRTFNSLGELVAWHDNAGHDVSATYDAESRMTDRTEPDYTTHWTWGTSATAFNIGHLASVGSNPGFTYSENFEYDSSGRVHKQTIQKGTDAYTYELAYSPTTGLLDTLTYPNIGFTPLTIHYGYQNGILKTVGDGMTTYWTADTLNPRGQITQQSLGNGLITGHVFDPITGWLSSAKTGTTSNPTAQQNASYFYDFVGNVTQRQNNKLGITEDLVYGNNNDHLYRLDHSTVTFNGTPTTNFAATYSFDGNIETKNDILDTQPVGQTINWTSFDYPYQITSGGQTASFVYGPDRQRLSMSLNDGTATETTEYIGDFLEKISVAGSPTAYRHVVVAGGRPIAIFSRAPSGATSVQYLALDHQGSIDSISSSAGAALASESFSAFGLRRDANTWNGEPASVDRAAIDAITRQGYTFQTMLGAMGLNHMNGRVQDARTGTFLSPDPFVDDPDETQDFNRYAYVYNNPVTFTDPSGFDCEPYTYATPLLPIFGSYGGASIPDGGGGVGGAFIGGQVVTVCRPSQATPGRPSAPTPLIAPESPMQFVLVNVGTQNQPMLINMPAGQAGADAVDAKIPRLVIGFRGAGLGFLNLEGDTPSLTAFVQELNGTMYEWGPAARGSAQQAATAFAKAHPNGEIVLMGYSRGGRSAFAVANALGDAGIAIHALILFDPHDADDPELRLKHGNVASAFDFYQRNPRSFGNPFNGRPLAAYMYVGGDSPNHHRRYAPSVVQGHNYTGESGLGHLNIVSTSLTRYGGEIREAINRH